MKIAYIFLAHKNPKQLARLINRLNTPDSVFSIHIDGAADLEDFRREIAVANPDGIQIHFQEKRYRARWGGFNAVRATAELIESVLPLKPDNIIFMSGQDYPLKSNEGIRSYLTQYQGKALMEWRPVDFEPGKPNRINRYYFCDYFDWEKGHMLPRMLTKVLPARTPPQGLNVYIGRVQFVMPLDIATYVVAEYRNNKKLNDFFKYVLCVDELYFQTILLNSRYADRTVDLRTHFADYAAPHPLIWTADSIEHLKQQPTLFARKFDSNVDEKVLDLLDETIKS